MTTSPEPSVTLHDAMTAAALRDVHPRLHEWYDDPTLAMNMRAHLAEGAGWIGDEEFGAAYRDGVAVIDVPEALDWANRVIPLPGDGWAVTGIRFRNRDLSKPFVEIVAHSAGGASPDEHWHTMADEIGRAYAPFTPGKLQVFAADPERTVETFTRLGWRAEVDMYLVAGQIDDLRARPRVARFDDVTLIAVSPERAAEVAGTAYAALASITPGSALWASPQTLDDLAAYAQEGLLFGIEVDERLTGVVAATRRDACGMTGFSVEEIVLDAGHRGRRLAGAVLQQLIDRLPAAADDVLWGTIHPDNAPSLRNALGVGREIVGANLWIEPPGWPRWN